jgi:CheY-like chemotaxis protein
LTFRTAPAPAISATVLIADDEPSMRLLVRATIESDQYQVLEASDGDQAWSMIQEHKPSVVLLDVQMPGRSGLEVLAMVRGDPNLAATRVIMLTAKALKADIEVGITAGADLYLTKPFSPLDLLTRVDEALGRWRSALPPGSLVMPAAC